MKLVIWSNSSDATATYIVERAPIWLYCQQVNTDVEHLFTIGSNIVSAFSNIDLVWYRRPFENKETPVTVGEKVKAAELEEALWNLMLQVPFQ